MKAVRLIAGIVMALGVGFAHAQAQAPDAAPQAKKARATTLRLGWTNTIDSHYGVAVTTFGDEVAKRTGGRYKIQYFSSGALGGEKEMLEDVQKGQQDMIITSTGPVGGFVPETRIVDIPYLFRDYDHARKVLDGPIGQDILSKFPAKGLVAISWMENGFRHITNNKRPVKTPDDVKGLKLCTMENKVHMEAFKAMGSFPTPMNMNDVFPSLQSGVIDGQENPIPVILANSFYTVQKYVTLDAHVYSPALLVINKGVWEKMSEADKTAFKEAAKISLTANRKKVNDDEANGIAIMQKYGTEVITQVDNAAFQKAVQDAYVVYNKEFGADNIKKIMDVK